LSVALTAVAEQFGDLM